MKKIIFAALAALGLVYAGAAFAGGVPLIPSTSQFSEPSQILNTLNTFIQTLNGQTTAIGTPGNVSLGKFCTGSSSTTAVTCNGSHGILSLTSVGDLASADSMSTTSSRTRTLPLARRARFRFSRAALLALRRLFRRRCQLRTRLRFASSTVRP